MASESVIVAVSPNGMVRDMRTRKSKVWDWVTAYVSDPGDECTVWPFARKKADGRAVMWDPRCRNMVMAGRITWEISEGRDFPLDAEARHLCGNGHLGCVNPRHIMPGTRSENIHDRVVHGVALIGERNPAATLTEQKVREICHLVANGERQVDVAARFGITKMHVNKIWTGRSWSHVDAPRKGW